MEIWQIVLWIIVLFFALSIYFFPAATAYLRKHRQCGAIFVLNLLLGWTLLGWVGALVWAYIVPSKRD